MVKEKSSNSRIFDKDGYRKVSIKICENLFGKAKKGQKEKIRKMFASNNFLIFLMN
jgi:hypothetical protein